MKINFEHKISLRVRYSETDQMGYCYHGNYAQYFEVGRVETLRELGLSYKSLEDQGYMLPVAELSVNYKFPAKYDDNLTIKTSITEMRGARLAFEYTITNEEEQLIATATTMLVFVAKETMRPISPPTSFVKLIEPHEQK
ncbi:MAG: acyl-CoA thioesterase [Crocinitomicaceae bacterium]|nr:acyl-CoA thioesterase [Flavobacteriales bacterium]NQZ34244.1 acyl-CoA thioesterase [Crocinitomicaceae bacterium]PHR36709.1 MAG: thioesterase [Fluviicola sp.]